MTTITLLPHHEKLAPADAVPEYRDSRPLLYHQARTYEALQSWHLVMNTYPPGSGKTTAALLHLLHPSQRQANTLLIAPTNALIDQHVADIEEFIARNDLSMRVIKVNAPTLQPLLKVARPGEVVERLRPGEALQRLIENPLTFAEQLGWTQDAQKQPSVIVTNPDIFYLALYFQYRHHDQRNVFAQFVGRFRYIVIDEFHYYDSKQFANFLFFFALWKQWGYFEHGHRICLLSATPRDNVYTYLDRVFGKGNWLRIGPDNEPVESAGLATIPTLTELELTIVASKIHNWVAEQRKQIEQWQSAGLDCAIISSSLQRINTIHYLLRDLDRVRITGPEPHASRQRVSSLILATPTVDIGYNFGRPDKSRQSIDCLICDARFGDELTQRIGRAGRVLGRAVSDRPSHVVVVVSDDAWDELRGYSGQTLTRSEWAMIVQNLAQLPSKHRMEGYIRSHAITESFYPIFHIQKLSADRAAVLEELFGMVRDVFAPASYQSAKGLVNFFYKYEHRRRWLAKPTAQRWQIEGHSREELAQHFADYVSWQGSRKGIKVQYNAATYEPHLAKLLQLSQQKAELVEFVEAQVALTKALFTFREAWQGPQAALYDPHRLFSSEQINYYDVLHLEAYYEIEVLRDRQEFERKCGPAEETELYVVLHKFREPKRIIGFDYVYNKNRHDFEASYCRSVVALRGMRLTARTQGYDGKVVTLDQRIRDKVAESWIPCLVVAEESWGPLLSKLRGSPFYARDLQVDFADGSTTAYKIVTGTAAFHMLPELKTHFKMLDKKLDDDAIVL